MNTLPFLRIAGLIGFCFAINTHAESPAPMEWDAEQDHANMMEQLGIQTLRKWKDGRAEAEPSHAANYDEALATPYPDLPELLVLENGEAVTTPETWWKQRRPELVEYFENEVYGRIPDNMPQVNWKVFKEIDTGEVAGLPVIGRQLVGVVDNSSYPDISVEISANLVLPKNAKGPVPVLIMFSWRKGPLPGEVPEDEIQPNPFLRQDVLPSHDQLISAGWGYVELDPRSFQADNGAGLTRGIIGLLNKGQPRSPSDWGALRAWAWGAARTLDYLETLPEVNAKKVGIEGVSRYGKAALVTMALEERFAIGFIASSGKGGATLHRRNFGEDVGNLVSSGAYHWMAGNYMKYGTIESDFGKKTADDLSVDSHELIALCAPRPTFISYGIPEKGDALWLDQQGSYMATVAAGPAFVLLGAKDIGETDNYHSANMPPHNTDMLDGQLAWRQHDGGHESQSNMSHFIKWANEQLGYESGE